MAEAVDTCYNIYVRCDSMYTICSHCLYKLVLQRLHGSYAPEGNFCSLQNRKTALFSDF